jgi:hypothetical protein
VVGVLVQSADTLLEGEQGCVDLGAFHPTNLVVVHRVTRTLTSSEIDEGDPTHIASSGWILQVELDNGVRPRRRIIGTGSLGRPRSTASLDHRHDVVGRVHSDAFEPPNMDGATAVFASVEQLPPMQEVVQLSAIDLVKRSPHHGRAIATHPPEMCKQICCAQIVQSRELAGNPHHGVCLAGPGLPVGKARHLAPTVDSTPHQWSSGLTIHVLVAAFYIKGLIESEGVSLCVVLHVDSELWGSDGATRRRFDLNHISFVPAALSLPKRTLSDAHANPDVAQHFVRITDRLGTDQYRRYNLFAFTLGRALWPRDVSRMSTLGRGLAIGHCC